MNKRAFLNGYLAKNAADDDTGMSSTTKGALLGAAIPSAMVVGHHGVGPAWGAFKGLLTSPKGIALMAFLGLTGGSAAAGAHLASVSDEHKARNARKKTLGQRSKNMNPFA
jgi:hypothetical protein